MIRNEQDHPRGCGEHPAVDRATRPRIGSSPRMRGARHGEGQTGLSAGIIPADAGSTGVKNAWSGIGEDHPRGCGEHSTASKLIPAGGDHPRGCGEHELTKPAEFAEMGSSPRMRGAQIRTITGRPQQRIIPADAGSTAIRNVTFVHTQDHPRGCGEHIRKDLQTVSDRGSSPRMRGALLQSNKCVTGKGIIPADAGSTPTFSVACASSGDHPRGCGEHRLSGKGIS